MAFTPSALGELNAHEINWSPGSSTPCTACKPLIKRTHWPPNAGSYASMLKHFEATCGRFPVEPNPKLRLLVLFQDPRPDEDNFTAIAPLSTTPLGPTEHRYFCLTPVAWKDLHLDEWLESESPRWREEANAHHYLHRYFRIGRGGKSWAYDAIIAYFLWLLRPADAYVTNLAKCFFGDATSQPFVVIPTCVGKHLVREVELFRPTLVLSFVSRVRSLGDLHEMGLPRETSIRGVLPALHPAARTGGHEGKRARFRDGLLAPETAKILKDLDVNPREIAASWDRHVDALFVGR